MFIKILFFFGLKKIFEFYVVLTLLIFSLTAYSQATIIKTINSNCELELCLSCGHAPVTWNFSNPSAITDLGGGATGWCAAYGKTVIVTGFTSVTVNYDKWGCSGFGPGNMGSITFSLSPADMIPSKKATSITASSTTICAGQSVMLTKNGGSLSNNGVWKWYQGGCGSGASIGSGNSISVTPSSTTTYFVRAEDDCGNTVCRSVTVTVNPLPSQPGIISGATPICGGSQTYSISSVAGAISYTWSYSGGGTPSGTGVSTTFTPTSSGTLSVTATNSCGTSVARTLSIVVSSAPSQPGIISGATPICGGSQTYSISSVAGATSYTWSYSGGGTPSGTGVSTTFTPTSSGTLSVTATNSCGTSSAASISINLTSGDDPSFSYPNTTYCLSGNDPVPTITGLSGGAFSGNNSLAINSNTGEISLVSSGVGIFDVVYVTNGICPDSSTFQIAITSAPNAAFNYPSGASVCLGNGTLNVILSTGASNGVYSSTTGLSLNSINGEVDLSLSVSGTYIVTNTIVASGSCIATSATDTITLLPLDNAGFNYGGDSVFCENESNVSASITGVLNGSFTSSPTGLSMDAQGNIDFSNSILDILYTVTYSAGNVCPNADSMTILIHSSPNAPVLFNDTSICNGDSIELLASGVVGVSYPVYDAAFGGNLLGYAPLTVSPNSNTGYYIQSVNTNGCINVTGAQTVNVVVYNIPIVDLGTDVDLCPGDSVLLTVQQSGIYTWSTNEISQSIYVVPSLSTLYWVDYIDANQCVASDSIIVNVIALGGSLIANDDDYTVNLSVGNTFSVLFNDVYSGAVLPAIIQNPYNGNSSVNFNGQITYESTNGTGYDSLVYEICDATCPNICDSATVFITVEENIEIKIPGGLSPNGDFLNDVFYIEGLNQFESTKLTIFNRWGGVVFSDEPYLNDWDGVSNTSSSLIGERVTSGTYYYILEVMNESKQFTGFIEVK